MKSSTTLRAGLGVLAAAAALSAMPSMASAASSCTFDTSTKTMTVTHDAPAGKRLILSNGPTIQYHDEGGYLYDCVSSSGVHASVYNTAKILIKAPSNPAGYQMTVLDERNGQFKQVSGPRIRISVMTGSGSDYLGIVEGGSQADHVNLHSGSPTVPLSIGPAIDMDGDGQNDIGMTDAGLVSVSTAGGDDTVDAHSVTSYSVELLGGAGRDTLVGGAKADWLRGGDDDDALYAVDGRADFAVDGGAGSDSATVDYQLDPLTSIEKPSYKF
jgi:hypothetical protein